MLLILTPPPHGFAFCKEKSLHCGNPEGICPKFSKETFIMTWNNVTIRQLTYHKRQVHFMIMFIMLKFTFTFFFLKFVYANTEN